MQLQLGLLVLASGHGNPNETLNHDSIYTLSVCIRGLFSKHNLINID
jgi:hypothetical protein